MSSNEEEFNDPENPSSALHGSKKRRIQRACDVCRRKKIRCDGGQMPGNRCSNCIAYNFDCLYVEAAKKRGPPKGYVESLENRLDKMEKLLRKFCPDIDFTKELGGNFFPETWADKAPPPLNHSSLAPSALTSPPVNSPALPALPSASAQLTPSQMATSIIRGVGSPIVIPDELFPSDDDLEHVTLADNLKRLSLDPHQYRFFGKSSGAMLIQTAIDLKNEYAAGSDVDLKRPPILGAKRAEFWTIRPWERASAEQRRPDYNFPEDDLIMALTDLYFTRVNIFLPFLHRPTFEKSIAEGLHLVNDAFGETLLLVCAVGARYSNDPRVLLDGTDSPYSCGWKWFDQVQMVRKSLLAPPCLYDLQFYCLTVQFLQGSSAPQACWTMVGIGIRLAQDVGAHRRKARNHEYTVDDELWKRAFWALVTMDRLVSSALGRPCAIQDEDFDLDLPVECDDEFWEHPDPQKAFKQPPNKPSIIAYFNCYLKLNQVLAFSLRTIYSINKSKILLGFVGQQWEQHIVAELDSALNKWIDSVPDHLRWDPNRENQTFFDQSVSLYSSYYQLQILIHRPFIPSPRKPSPLSFPSLAICTNAARSCSHVVDIQRRRSGIHASHIQMAVFTAGVVLLLNIWGGKRSGLSTDTNKEMADVHKCMQVLRVCEQRWHSAGRLWDILYELASVGELPLPQASPAVTNKRERNSDSPISTASVEVSPSTSTFPEGPRSIAGARRISSMDLGAIPRPQVQQPQTQQQSTPHQPQTLFALPMYSDELGRLPLHGQVKFSVQGEEAPLESNTNYWYPAPTSNQMPPPPPPSVPAPHLPNRASNSNMNTVYPVDELFYDQMTTNFTNSFSQAPSAAPHYRLGGDAGGAMQPMSSGVDPRQHAMPSRQAMMDNDTIAMWSNAPTGFELDDWGTYLTNVSELTQNVHSGTGPLGEHGQ